MDPSGLKQIYDPFQGKMVDIPNEYFPYSPKTDYSSSTTFYYNESGQSRPNYTTSTTFYYSESETVLKSSKSWPSVDHNIKQDFPNYANSNEYHGGTDFGGNSTVNSPIFASVRGYVISSTFQYSDDYLVRSGIKIDGKMEIPYWYMLQGNESDKRLRVEPYGNNVLIQTPDGNLIRYAHLQYSNYFVVKEGDYVDAGELIGYMGSTGNTDGVHLHFEVYGPPRYRHGNYVSPLLYLP